MREAIGAAKMEIVAEVREIVVEAVRDSQTELLRAFLTYQESTNVRMRTIEAKATNVDTGLSLRVENVEKRLWEIERKLLLNPPAA
jgi:hypothetical protein